MSKLTLYGIWLSGPTYKAGLAMSLMGQAFAYKHVDLRAGAHKQPDYLAINRFGQVPALVDGDLKLCQSGSILLYLADKFGKMGGKTRRGEGTGARVAVLGGRPAGAQRLPPARHQARLHEGRRQRLHALHRPGERRAQGARGLAGQARPSWSAASRRWPTSRSMATSPMPRRARIDLSPYANVKAWMGRIEKLPGFKKYEDVLPKQDAA